MCNVHVIFSLGKKTKAPKNIPSIENNRSVQLSKGKQLIEATIKDRIQPSQLRAPKTILLCNYRKYQSPRTC